MKLLKTVEFENKVEVRNEYIGRFCAGRTYSYNDKTIKIFPRDVKLFRYYLSKTFYVVIRFFFFCKFVIS